MSAYHFGTDFTFLEDYQVVSDVLFSRLTFRMSVRYCGCISWLRDSKLKEIVGRSMTLYRVTSLKNV